MENCTRTLVDNDNLGELTYRDNLRNRKLHNRNMMIKDNQLKDNLERNARFNVKYYKL